MQAAHGDIDYFLQLFIRMRTITHRGDRKVKSEKRTEKGKVECFLLLFPQPAQASRPKEKAIRQLPALAYYFHRTPVFTFPVGQTASVRALMISSQYLASD